ncbi:MAG: MFS transporter, partial [Hyphomicrobiales bacterium]|nr:MFS transporter [Hyphomicrobiales bacterium]
MAFLTLAMAIAMAVLDGTIVTVALPTMARQFAVAPENAIWIVNAFQLAVTVSLLPLAALGDMLGYRRVYWWGLALFTVASLACALAPTFAVLTLARVVQGLGAAGIMSVNIALIRFIYPHARLGQGVGNIALVVAICSAGSPSLAAAILSVASWHWLFLINVPIGALALIMAARTLPATPRAAGRLDLQSVILNALTFGLVIAGVNGIGQGGASSLALIEIAVGAAFGVALVRRQLKLPAPLL